MSEQLLERPQEGSEPRWRTALTQANRVRLARAELKRQLTAGELAASEVIVSCPWEARGMSISDVLMSQHRWGRARCCRLLRELGLSETKPVGALTGRQRSELGRALDTIAGRQDRD